MKKAQEKKVHMAEVRMVRIICEGTNNGHTKERKYNESGWNILEAKE